MVLILQRPPGRAFLALSGGNIMFSQLKWIFGFVILCLGCSVGAQIRLGEPLIFGDGCRPGTVATSLSPDLTAISVIYDDYVVKAAQGSGQRDRRSGMWNAQKVCINRIPLFVDRGIQIQLIQADHRGFAFVPAGARAEVESMVNANLMQGNDPRSLGRSLLRDALRTTHVLSAGHAEDFFFRQSVGQEVWSPCSQNLILWVNSAVRVSTRSEEVTVQMDSTDLSSESVALQFRIRTRACR